MPHTPLTISFRHMNPSEKLRDAAQQEVQRLRRTRPDFAACSITVERPNHSHHKGESFRVHVVALSSRNSRHRDACAENEDPYAALQKAFERVARQLERQPRPRRAALSEDAA